MNPANPCPICSQPIPERPRGSRHGHPPKTCSEKCRRARASLRERVRYQRVKNSVEWKETRKKYVEKLRAKLAADPQFAVIFRAESAARVREWNASIRAHEPTRHEAMKAERRAERAAWRERLVNDPEAWAAHKAAARAWYHSLSSTERDRIYYQPRRKREESK